MAYGKSGGSAVNGIGRKDTRVGGKAAGFKGVTGGGGKTTKVGPISTPFTNAMKTSIGGKR